MKMRKAVDEVEAYLNDAEKRKSSKKAGSQMEPPLLPYA